MTVTVDDADRTIFEFCGEHPSIAHLTIWHAPTQEAFYGPEYTIEKYGYTIKGAFLPVQGAVQLPLASFRDCEDLQKSLRHEIYGHYGSLTFSTEDKRTLLGVILSTRDSPSMEEAWAIVDKEYKELSEMMKAEEVFCLLMESIDDHLSIPQVKFDMTWDEVFLQKVRRLHFSDLLIVAKTVADGIKNGTRSQQIFPLNNQSQFRAQSELSSDCTAKSHASDGTHAKSGRHIGTVLKIENEIVQQKIGRYGEISTHNLEALTSSVKVGELVDIHYRDGIGIVAGRDAGREVQR